METKGVELSIWPIRGSVYVFVFIVVIVKTV